MKRTPSRKKPTVADLDASLSVLHQVVVDMQTREFAMCDRIGNLETADIETLSQRQDQLRDRLNKTEARLTAVEIVKQPWYRRLWARYTDVVAQGAEVEH